MAVTNTRITPKKTPSTGGNAVDVQFRERKSVSARARQRKPRRAANDNEVGEVRQNVRQTQRELLKKTVKKKVARKAIKGLGAGLIYVSGAISILIAVLGILSLALFGGHSAVQDTWVVSWLAGDDLLEAATFMTILTMIVSFISYLGFIIFFSVLQSNPLKSLLGLGTTVVALAHDMLPIVQIFPWLMVWVLLVAYTPVGE
jgi:magnesium-transporting ATPase (P-type)